MCMWRSMYECHQVQKHIVQQLEYLNTIPSKNPTSEIHKQSTLQLELEVQQWHQSFCNLFKAHHDYIQSLTGWLRLTLFQFSKTPINRTPEESKIYTLCEEWHLAVDRIPDKVASEGIKILLTVIHAIALQQAKEQKQKKKSDSTFKELEKKVVQLRSLECKYGPYSMPESSGSLRTRDPITEKRTKVDALKAKADEEKSKYNKSVSVTRAMTLNNLQMGCPHVFQGIVGFSSVCMEVFESVYNKAKASEQEHDAMLRGFELASGLKINFAKSQFGIFGVEAIWIHEAAQFLNCRHMETPFYYLGIPIGAKSTSSLVWESLISKYEDKLSKWNQKILSMAGKELPVGGDQGHKKIPWVKWEVICLPKEDGGLGVKDISKFNTALMGRWVWALSSNHNQLWAKILLSKYGGWSDLSSGRDKSWHSQWWRDLRKIYQQPEFSIIQQQMVWKVGGGEKIKFWKDNWLGEDYKLEQQFNQLFLISDQQNSTISNMGTFSQGNWCWDLKWRRNLFDYEQHTAVTFMEAITDIQIQPHMQDIRVWKADPSGIYSTKSTYRLLRTSNPIPEAKVLYWMLRILD
ncbi:Nitrate regulatory gene2 protein [Glycine soja]|uniref:Nitrate regulatory gene2 protein n=2 Tax=Glycine soja TaxID=3848 RepID=A0A445FC61_GLYSO|nr:Nitrate regulatory gene2 protein [Glycine soja]